MHKCIAQGIAQLRGSEHNPRTHRASRSTAVPKMGRSMSHVSSRFRQRARPPTADCYLFMWAKLTVAYIGSGRRVGRAAP